MTKTGKVEGSRPFVQVSQLTLQVRTGLSLLMNDPQAVRPPAGAPAGLQHWAAGEEDQPAFPGANSKTSLDRSAALGLRGLGLRRREVPAGGWGFSRLP